MNILILAGSARPKGTSSLLVKEFRRGAMEMGAAVEVFSAGTAMVHGCTGCGHCAHGKNACIFQDDMQALYPKFLAADLIVIATPVYNWGITAQLKMVFDRWQPVVLSIRERKKVILLTTQAGRDAWITEPVEAWYKALLRFMEWESAGRLAAVGVMERADIEATDYPAQAYALGRQVCAELTSTSDSVCC